MFIPASDGRWVDENFARLKEIINEYDPHLDLCWIPTDKRTTDDKKPYVIVDTRTNTAVFYASELDTPTDILARLFEGDNKHGDVLQRLEARNAATEAFRYKERLDTMEEAAEYAEFLFKSPLNTVRHNGKKLDDQRRLVGPAIERTNL